MSRLFARAVLFGLALWMAVNLAQTINYVVADYSQIPVADYWRVPQYWPEYKAFHFERLWTPHNEHRIVFPELVYILDMSLAHGRMYLPIAVSGLCHFGVWCALVWAAYSRKEMESPAREIALLLAGILIAWRSCSTVIATPFQLAFTMMQFMVVLSLLFLAKVSESGRVRDLLFTIGTAAIATYSVGNGLLIWPLLIGEGLFLKLRGKQMAALWVAAFVFVGIYFIGYHPPPSAMSANAKHPFQALQFLCSYMSMPFGSFNLPPFGIVVGAANLLLMGLCFAVAWRRRLLSTRLGVMVFGAYLFLLMSSLLTTGGRMDLNDTRFVQAKAWRYVTMPTEGWALLTIAVIWLSGQARFAIAAVLAVFFAYGFTNSRAWVESTRIDNQNAQVAAEMLRDGVFDPNQVHSIFPDAEFVRIQTHLLRHERKAIWARGDDKWIGQDVTHLLPSATPIPGRVTRVYPVAGGVELFGWADEAALSDDHAVLFVDENQKIVGLGKRPPAGMPPDISSWDTPNHLAFVGYVSYRAKPEKLRVFISTFHGKIWRPLDGAVDVPTIRAMTERTDVPPVLWQSKGVSNRSVTADAPANHCIVLPVLHGTATYGASVAVRDADTKQPFASLPMLDGRSFWERWRIPIPDATQNVEVVADEEGSGPNEWLAIAAPEQCP